MNGVHDMGGMDGFGPIQREDNEPVFHADWERRVFALALATMRGRHYNVDEFRRTIERIPPARYLESSYYERWLDAMESLLIEKGVVTAAELGSGRDAVAMPPGSTGAADGPPASIASEVAASRDGASAARRDRSRKPRFKPRDRVVARNMNPPGHTRIPRYVRGRRGAVQYDWGVFVFPDTHAHGLGGKPQHCYAVEFAARELWGVGHSGRVVVDLWEDYLDRDRSGAAAGKSAPRPRKRTSRAPIIKSKTSSKSRRAR